MTKHEKNSTRAKKLKKHCFPTFAEKSEHHVYGFVQIGILKHSLGSNCLFSGTPFHREK